MMKALNSWENFSSAPWLIEVLAILLVVITLAGIGVAGFLVYDTACQWKWFRRLWGGKWYLVTVSTGFVFSYTKETWRRSASGEDFICIEQIEDWP